MSIAFGGIVAFLFRGMNLAVALATVVLTSRLLEEAEYGRFVLALTVVGILNAVTGGLTAAVAYQVSNQRRPAGTAFLGGAIPAGVLGLAAIGIGIGVGAGLGGDGGGLAAAAGAAGAAVILNSVAAGVFLGRGSLVRYNVALVLPPLLSLVFIAVTFLALDQRSPAGALSAYAAGQWAALILLTLTGAGQLFAGMRFEGALAATVVRFALLAGLSSGISYLNYRADLFVVRHFEGDDGVATYSQAVYIGESIWQVSGSLALAMYARVGSLTRPEAAELTARVMRHTIVLLGVLCVVLLAGADLVQLILFPDYDGMANALRFLVPGVLLYGLAQSFSGFYTYQRGLPWVAAVVAGTGLVVDIGLATLLVPALGVNGAALASSIAYGTAIIGGLAVFLRQERLPASRIFRFSRADLADYRQLVETLRARLRPAPGDVARDTP
ncbi:MAG: polysaccharide biosynthesis C-terminal domain-containing protein [Dehalococcoidia bacterium]|nr:polysaccharide biosynthesis C-terminal domain-containing protein [Dehalococcoidia bacterium]